MAPREMVRRARELHAREGSWAKVARRLGVSKATAWRWGTEEKDGDLVSEAEKVRLELANGRLRRLGLASDAAGLEHELGLVRVPGGLELVVDRPATGEVRMLARLAVEEDEAQAWAICVDYRRRIAGETDPVCRAVRLSELRPAEEA